MPFLSRRSLLVGGASLGALAAVGVPAAVLPDAAPGFRVLSAGEAETIAALGEAFFPAGNPLGVSSGDVDLPLLVDALMADELDPVVQPVFRYLLRGLEVGTLASRGASFGSLPLAERRDVVETWSDNVVFPRRLAHDALKGVLGMAFFNAPAVTDRIGWSPSCHGRTS
jgi:hypothetical protein